MLNINDRIRVKNYENIISENKTKGFGRVCGKRGYIIAKFYSPLHKKYLFKIKLDECKTPSTLLFTADMLVKESFENVYFKTIVADNLVIARMYDTKGRIVAEGHGHIFNGNGEHRIAQATSFAYKRLYESLCPKGHDDKAKNTKRKNYVRGKFGQRKGCDAA